MIIDQVLIVAGRVVIEFAFRYLLPVAAWHRDFIPVSAKIDYITERVVTRAGASAVIILNHADFSPMLSGCSGAALFEADLDEGVFHRLAGDPDDSPERRIQLLRHFNAPATASAQRNRARIAVALRGANRPKLKKRRLSQNTTTSTGTATPIVSCSTKSHRSPAIALTSCSACDCSQR
jgi:hypothetical protein